MPLLEAGSASALVEPGHGGRIASLVVRGTEFVVGPDDGEGHRRGGLDWGIYPMAPFAGRVRNGEFGFGGVVHRLDRRMPPHAIHGTVDDAVWDVVSLGSAVIVMRCALGPRWPFAGEVTHTVSLTSEGLRMELSLRADQDMPAQVGWHPWFRRPAVVSHSFAAWLPRDPDGLPGPVTSDGVPMSDGPVDDCFVSDGAPVRVIVDGVPLVLQSNCSHWVLYNGARHGVCAEPQSGPPNEIASSPQVVDAGGRLTRWFEITW